MFDITEENFEAEVAGAGMPVLIDFYADWCGPCKQMPAVLEQVEPLFSGRVKFGRVDTAAQRKLRIRFGVASLPTLSLYRDGSFVDVADGLVPAHEIAAHMETVLAGEHDPRLERRVLDF